MTSATGRTEVVAPRGRHPTVVMVSCDIVNTSRNHALHSGLVYQVIEKHMLGSKWETTGYTMSLIV